MLLFRLSHAHRTPNQSSSCAASEPSWCDPRRSAAATARIKPCRPTVRRLDAERRRLAVRAIGFDLGGSTPARSVEKRAADLGRDAASLLLFQSALEGKTAQAFLKVLLSLQRKSAEDTLSNYGDFHREMVANSSKSWQDHLLDEVLNGRNNAWAKAVANGEERSDLTAAVEHDLDLLMRLALGDKTLASMVKEAHPDVPEAWISAASAIGSAPATDRPETNRDSPTSGDAGSESVDGDTDFVQGPPTDAERSRWRERIAGHWRWSQAAPELRAFFKRHGAGLTQRHSILEWRSEALQAFTPFKPEPPEDGNLSEELLRALEERTLQGLHGQIASHLQGGSSRPLALSLTSRMLDTSWHFGLNQPAMDFRESGLRIVLIPHATLAGFSAMHSLARALTQHKRIRFLVVVGLDEPARTPEPNVLCFFSGHRGIWPQNALPLLIFHSADGDTGCDTLWRP